MEYPRHYRVVVRVLDELFDDDKCPQVQDELERLLVWDSNIEERMREVRTNDDMLN